MATRRNRAGAIKERRLPGRRTHSASAPSRPSSGHRVSGTRSVLVLYISIGLIAITWLVFGKTLGHDFVNFDDHVYVYDNPAIARGLTADGLISAVTQFHARNWHPLTTISHMLDCQLFGLKAGGHHFTNALLHSIAVMLLFLVLNQMTGALWQSAFVASLFAIHPLHVESVAWVSERKDVLSAVFFMLTLWAYARYVRKRSFGRYLSVALFFALGLMSKPMLVTLPFVLLLLDYWPLSRIGRLRSATAHQGSQKLEVRGPLAAVSRRWSVVSGLLREKIPLFALSAFSCAVTLMAQSRGGGTDGIDQLPVAWRLNNAVLSYTIYIGQMFWPVRLAVFYPHPNNQLPLWQVTLALLFLVAVSLCAIFLGKQRPYVLTGWFWYVGMLVPVIGFVQVGEQARADRYTYLPQIGLYVLIVWAIADLLGSHRARRMFVAIAAPIAIAALSLCAFVQTSYWKNSETLWKHTLAVTSHNDVAHNNLGYLSLRRGQLDEAIFHFNAALNIRSGTAASHYNLGRALIENNLANGLARKGLRNEAIAHYEEAVKLRPDYADAYYNFGSVLFQEGRIDDAITHWQKAAAIQPRDAEIHTSLGNAFGKKRMLKEAIVEYEEALKIEPQHQLAMNNLAWILATSSDASIRDGARALQIAQQASYLSGDGDPNLLRTLAAAYAETGRFSEALLAAEQAMRVAAIQGKAALADVLEKEITLYRSGIPLRGVESSN
jgi:tetratricopeptide (TPR) repeat protein